MSACKPLQRRLDGGLHVVRNRGLTNQANRNQGLPRKTTAPGMNTRRTRSGPMKEARAALTTLPGQRRSPNSVLPNASSTGDHSILWPEPSGQLFG